ncbi:TonB-dependent receptor [Steroidobacter flavus]|uniref:TonB-dependent receptor n=1 Tax=Steroidobacter flavus TaxID=1842136 RepID=A0ABV8SZC9_9GAMM
MIVRESGLGAGVSMAVCAMVSSLSPQVTWAREAPDAGVEEVIVTARRRAENLQDVPIPVTAVSGQALTDLGVATLEDINSVAPNIKVNSGRGSSNTINAYIRGVGQNDPLWGFEPGVGIYIDDVYMARPQGALLDVYDVERIEVLRGPQGTLYGKNTLAGAIKYVTRDIVGDPYLNASVAAGSYNQLDLKVSGSIGLTDQLYVSAALAKLTHDGYGEVRESTTPQQFNKVGEDVSDKDVFAARAKIAYVFSEDTRLEILGDLINDDSNARGGQRLTDALAPRLPDRYDVRNDTPVDEDKIRIRGVSAIFNTGFSDALKFKVIGAYREGDADSFIDFDELNLNALNVPAVLSDDQTSGEIQLNYDAGGRLRGVTGLYYFDGTACGSFNSVLGLVRVSPLVPQGLTNLTQGCVDTRSLSAYADGTFAVTDRFNINAGVRWNEDRKEATVFVANYAGAPPANGALFDRNNIPAGFVPLGVDSDYTSERTFSDVSPRLGVDFKITDDAMLYASYAQGFKSGGFDMRGNAAVFPGTRDGYDSESVDNYEIGLKSEWFGRRLLLNLTAFLAEYTDVQIGTQQFVVVNGLPRNVTAVLNAGEQENKGVELEISARPVEGLDLTANVGWLDAEVTEFLTSDPGNLGQIIDISNTVEPINAPDLTVYLGAAYRMPIAGGEGLVRVGWQYRSDTKVQNLTASVTDQPAYDVIDATVAWTSDGGRWRFALDGRNLADEEYRTSGYDFGPVGSGLFGGISQIGFYGPPRTWTVSAIYSFE